MAVRLHVPEIRLFHCREPVLGTRLLRHRFSAESLKVGRGRDPGSSHSRLFIARQWTARGGQACRNRCFGRQIDNPSALPTARLVLPSRVHPTIGLVDRITYLGLYVLGIPARSRLDFASRMSRTEPHLRLQVLWCALPRRVPNRQAEIESAEDSGCPISRSVLAESLRPACPFQVSSTVHSMWLSHTEGWSASHRLLPYAQGGVWTPHL